MEPALKRQLLKLLEEDEEFRLAVAGLLGLREILEELRKLREDFNTLIKEQAKRWEENERRWRENEKRWEENEKRWEENERKWQENFRRWEEADKKFKWIMAALGEIRDSLGGAFEYYTANVVKALLAERGIICGIRVNVTLPVDGYREVDIFCPDPLVVGEATTSLKTVEEAEREVEKLLSAAEAAEKFTGKKTYLKVLAVENAPTEVVQHLQKRAKELEIYLIVGREY
ncbi:hypothetical protein [Pyrobaculum calidifontis]|uniref:PaREP7 n=1 Tax=Pyrobaculum calidifontis (strain DSM 21063 / JCM 11548 / VA1) TaxID=410359 RepID=A3MTF3_PYRCJ|nr:hypothetical protein [Pyrobaculum calidifontis]ABO07920.1 hypothetical protein Pcal_0492 [Pyrobaculum calidifontis JCM 11548]